MIFRRPLLFINQLFLRCRRFDLLFPAAFFLRADFLHTPAFSGFDGQYRPRAFWTGFCNGWVPCGVVAIRISAAAVKKFAVAGFALDEVAFFALWALDAGVFGFFQRLDMSAFRIVGTADEFAAGTAVFVH